jgi:N-sulfoglucosamine sulfohydrolase
MKKIILFGLTFLAAGTLLAKDAVRPNILWITSEDNSISWVSCYGSQNATTPNIDKLAQDGFRYTSCFDNAAVCAPTRYTWLTGMHAISCGTQEMRSKAEIPKDVIYYNKQLQKAGYYTSNCTKTDYNLSSSDDPKKYWNSSGGNYASTWKKRKEGQPFFTVYNINQSHESRAFGNLKKGSKKDPAKMKLHSYHPDIPEIRETYAVYADSVERMDALVGKAIAKLKADGLYEDTIIIYNSDHGGVLPRSKRFLYASGVHCPLIVRIPEKWKHLYPKGKNPGDTVDRIVSFIDMPKTWLSLAGSEVPDVYQGKIFLGPDTEPEKEYHFSWRGRADARFDCVRMVRNSRYAYHKNYAPFAPAGQYLAYMHRMKATGAWEKYHKAGKTDAVTGRFLEPRV